MTSPSAKRLRTREHRRRIARLLTTVSALGFFASGAIANPEGGSVVAGAATIVETAPGNLEIHQTTDRAIIDWQSFSIGATESTHFAQPSASAIALNRVTGGDPSQILGRLSATGQFVLVNPNGVFFGANATVDVAGLVATTSDIRSQDFMAGRLIFRQPGRPGATVVNRGQISIRDGGLAALVAPGVENSGEIVARLGNITLASGDRFTIDLFGDGLINLAVGDTATSERIAADGRILTAGVVNGGRLVADGGQVILTAAAARNIVDRTINMDGVIEARSFVEQEGRITLFGGAAGEVRVAGVLDASGQDHAAGGRIDVFGEDIILAGNTTLDTSGNAGGGTIRIGGDYRGQGTAPMSASTDVRTDATIRANATGTGDGGRIILWSDGSTSYYGTASARGGTVGGDGGFVEVSGKQHLAFAGSVDTRAANGQTGQLLLDPTSIDICRGCTTSGAGTASSQLNVNDLVTNLNANNMTVSTNSAAAGDGDIDVNARIRWSSGNNLTLTADRDINLNQNLEARAQSDITLQAGGTVNMSAGRQISTYGGAVAVNATRVTLQRVTTRARGAIAGGGNVTVNAGTGGVELLQQIDARASSTMNGVGGTVNVTTPGNIVISRNIDASGYTGNAGRISITSNGGDIDTGDNARLLARGLRGSQGGAITLDAAAGSILVGATAGGGTRIDTRGLGAGSTANGGNIALTARTVTVNRNINASGSVGGNGGQVTVDATAGSATTQNIATRGGTTAGVGGTVNVKASADIDINRYVDTSGYTGNAGSITITSTGGDIDTGDSAGLLARGLSGGNGGNVTVRADNGRILVGAATGSGTRINTSSRGSGATGNGGDIALAARTVTLNRSINASGSTGGNGGRFAVTATAGNATTWNVTARGGTTAGVGGAVSVTASGDITARRSIDASGYTGNAGDIALTSTGGAISTDNNAALLARGLRGGNGGAVTLRADNGNIALGATAGNGTRIDTRGLGTGATGSGGEVSLAAQTIALRRDINASGSVGGDGGNVTVTATAGTTATHGITTRGGTAAGNGGAVSISASSNVTANRSVDTSAYTGNAGNIALTSTAGTVDTGDSAALRARGLRGGNGGSVTLRADNAAVTLGTTAGNGTRIDTRGLGTNSTGNGGAIALRGTSVILNRNVVASGGQRAAGGDVTITASTDAATTRGIVTRGGTVTGSGGNVSITADDNIDVTGGIDTSGYTSNAGTIAVSSANGTITTHDNAVLRTLGIRGGNAGSVTLRATNGTVNIGTTVGSGTRIYTRSQGAGSTGNGGDITITAGSVIVNRDINATGGVGGNGGDVILTASTGAIRTDDIVTRGGTSTGQGGNVRVTSSANITVAGRVDTSGYTGKAGSITLTSNNGNVATADAAPLYARGLAGGNGGDVSLAAANGTIAVGATAGSGTRIDSRSRGAGSTGNGGQVALAARAVTLYRDVLADGGAAGNGGDVSVTATAGNAVMRHVFMRGGAQAGRLTVAAAGDVTTAGTLRAGVTEITTSGAITVSVAAGSLQIGSSSAAIVGSIGAQSGNGAVGQLQIVNTNIPNPCTVNGFACILPAPPAVGPATVAAVPISADVAALTAAIDQASTPLALRVADQETPAQEAFVQSPLIGAVPADVFSGGYQLVRTPSIVPAAGPADGAAEDDEKERLDTIVPAAGPAPEDNAAPAAEVDAYFTQDLWSGLRNP